MSRATTYSENLRRWQSGERTTEISRNSAVDSYIDRGVRAAREAIEKERATAHTPTPPAAESVETRVEKAAAELRTTDPSLSPEEAVVKAYEEHPEWYEEECAKTDVPIAGYGSGPTDDEYEQAFGTRDAALKSVETPESAKVKRQLDDLIEAELRRLTAERARATGGKSAPAATREEALVHVLETTEGRRLRDAWLKAITNERRG